VWTKRLHDPVIPAQSVLYNQTYFKKGEEQMSQEIAKRLSEIEPQGDEPWEDILISVPVSIEVGDYSGCKKWIEGLRESGVEDLAAYFKENPVAVREGIRYMSDTFLLYNFEFLNMYDSNSMEEFKGITEGIDPVTDRSIYTDDFVGSFEQMFLAFARGDTRISCFTDEATVDKENEFRPFRAEVCWQIVKGYEDTWERVVVSVIPVDRLNESKRTDAVSST